MQPEFAEGNFSSLLLQYMYCFAKLSPPRNEDFFQIFKRQKTESNEKKLTQLTVFANHAKIKRLI